VQRLSIAWVAANTYALITGASTQRGEETIAGTVHLQWDTNRIMLSTLILSTHVLSNLLRTVTVVECCSVMWRMQ